MNGHSHRVSPTLKEGGHDGMTDNVVLTSKHGCMQGSPIIRKLVLYIGPVFINKVLHHVLSTLLGSVCQGSPIPPLFRVTLGGMDDPWVASPLFLEQRLNILQGISLVDGRVERCGCSSHLKEIDHSCHSIKSVLKKDGSGRRGLHKIKEYPKVSRVVGQVTL